MISYTTYKLLHFLGLFMMFVALGGASIHALSGGEKVPATRRVIGILHGVGALLALVAGFGMLARLELLADGLPGWVIAKLLIWLLLAALVGLPYRKRQLAAALAFALPLIALLAAWLALFKPF